MTVLVSESVFTNTNCITIMLLSMLTVKMKDYVDLQNTFQAQAANNRRKNINTIYNKRNKTYINIQISYVKS